MQNKGRQWKSCLNTSTFIYKMYSTYKVFQLKNMVISGQCFHRLNTLKTPWMSVEHSVFITMYKLLLLSLFPYNIVDLKVVLWRCLSMNFDLDFEI